MEMMGTGQEGSINVLGYIQDRVVHTESGDIGL